MRAHKLSLPDSVYRRLEIFALQKKAKLGTVVTASSVATEILNRYLPQFDIDQKD